MHPDQLRANLAKLGLSPELSEATVAYIRGGDVLDRAEVDADTANLVRAVHQSTWFRMEGCPHPAVTRSGTRAGNPFGEILFNLCFAAMLRELEAGMQEHELAPRLPCILPDHIFHPVPADHAETPFCCVSYLDYVAYATVADTPMQLIANFQQLVQPGPLEAAGGCF